uniref:serine/threonine-protein kinase atg1-like isoform X2 n=1 Tax=Ciona intestinalis TaxID=7719 RepID=UPI000EF4BAB8|nr:serine/threonine-protein kinase atg1-like isoform X2 [Ciona intestinalis]|eukprot:XP_026691674.1 serine/threonine-protein kinase atg1-like isoform X2 [Ciona intestinalis]
MAVPSDRFYNSDEIYLSEFDFNNPLGAGGFGVVVRAFHKKLGVVAIKCLDDESATKNFSPEKWIQKLPMEIQALQSLNHYNIVRMHGLTIWNNYLGVILDYHQVGNLHSLLDKTNPAMQDPIQISMQLKIRIAIDIASALCFLHAFDKKKRMVHGDMKPSNVLLDNTLHAKLIDFGTTVIEAHTTKKKASTSSKQTHKNEKGAYTICYCAPEFLENPFKRNKCQDVYSYGMILYQILSGKPPFSHIQEEEHIRNAVKNKQRPELEREKLLQPRDREISDCLDKVMRRCWGHEEKNRPQIFDVREILEQTFMSGDDNMGYELANEALNIVRKLHVKLITPMPTKDRKLSEFIKAENPINASTLPPAYSSVESQSLIESPKNDLKVTGGTTEHSKPFDAYEDTAPKPLYVNAPKPEEQAEKENKSTLNIDERKELSSERKPDVQSDQLRKTKVEFSDPPLQFQEPLFSQQYKTEHEAFGDQAYMGHELTKMSGNSKIINKEFTSNIGRSTNLDTHPSTMLQSPTAIQDDASKNINDGKYEEAIKLLNQYKVVKGEPYEQLCVTFRVVLCHSKLMHPDANKLFEQALEQIKRLPKNSMFGDRLYQMGELYRSKAMESRAMFLYKAAVDVYVEAAGTVGTRINFKGIMSCFTGMKQNDKQGTGGTVGRDGNIEFFRSMLQKVNGEFKMHRGLAESLSSGYYYLACCYSGRGDYKKASHYNKRSVQIMKDAYPDSYRKYYVVGYSMHNLANNQDNLGNYQAALEYYKKATEYMDQAIDWDSNEEKVRNKEHTKRCMTQLEDKMRAMGES